MIKLLKESQIMCNWSDSSNSVTVCCTSYNHANYIEQTIQGFLIQKTTFPFRILIHDDASTDGTVQILKEYQQRYPNLIQLILQDDNKYSKGEMILLKYIAPKCSGDYIAFCEGDDFWIDEKKLQKQVDILNKHKDCQICFHPTIGLRNNGKEKVISYYGGKELVIPVEDVIRGGGGYMPTASLVFHQSILSQLSEFYRLYPNPPIGDVIFQVLGSLNGGAVYTPDIASVYRIFANGSWSHRMQTDITFAKSNVLGLFRINKVLNEFSGYRYSSEFSENDLLLIYTYAFDPFFPRQFRDMLLKEYSPKKFNKIQIWYKNNRNRLRFCIKRILGYVV